MASKKSIWFRIGNALERTRHTASTPGRSVARLDARGERQRRRPPTKSDRSAPSVPSGDELMAAGIAMAVDRALAVWTGRSRPGITGLLRAGAAGAAAALLADLLRPLLRGGADPPEVDDSTADRILAGVGQGLVYGSIIEPRVPGPPIVKGALYGSIEYAADPVGGLAGLLGSHSPQRKLPVVGGVLDRLDAKDRIYLEHVVFGITLALLYGSNRSSNGIRPERE
jgi:hypothetical protein